MLATFFSINATDTQAMIGYGASLISDFMPILIILLGVGIAILIITSIFRK